ncbi:MAG TPA: ABC transporter permease [Candidatus Baltobacteraceae bacterium]|nr:ABC transporter permease [Candidatus Baltobacteraceae bacterium]
MQRIFAIAWLTWKAALRFKLFLVIAVLLILAVVGLPLVIKSDGTAQGFTQIILTYTLSAITALLGLSTLWLACGTLARDIEECQIQVVATKPIARWQIWLGKWLGIVTLNAALLAISGACVYGMLQWRATKLPEAEQKILREQVLVARGSAGPENVDAKIDADTEQEFQERLKEHPEMSNLSDAEKAEVRRQIREQVKASYEIVPPMGYRVWQIDLGFVKDYLRDKPLQLRIKFNSANGSASGTFTGLWQIGDPDSTNFVRLPPMSLAPDTDTSHAFHEFGIPPNLLDKNGVLTIVFLNPNNTSLLFPVEDGMEVLYPEGGFALNFARGLGIIFCWMALLATLGLAAASFMSFPVATFFSLAMLVVVLSSGTLVEAVENGTVGVGDEEKGIAGHSAADVILIPLFKGILAVVDLTKNVSPIDLLSTGRAISWVQLGTAFGQIVLLLGGIIAVIGIALFSRRELATAQGTQ